MTKRSLPQSNKRKHEPGEIIKVGMQTIGQVYKGVFEKDVSRRKHFLHSPEAIAYTITSLHAAERAGAEYCQVLDTDTGTIYRASIAKIWDMGKKFNRGWGDQVYLTLPNWTQTVDPEYTEIPPRGGNIKPLEYKSNATKGATFTPGAKQLSLFGGQK